MTGMITLKNPVASSVPSAVSISKDKVDSHGRSLGTGMKSDNDVVSAFLGNGLADKAKILGKISNNISYSTNALNVTNRALEDIASTLSDMLAVVAQAAGTSQENLTTLNDILQKKMAQVEQQTKNAEFDGRTLLTGDLGQDPTLRAKFNNNSVNVRSLPAADANNLAFLGAGAAASSTITINATLAAGDKVTLGAIEFKAVTGKPANENEFQIVTNNTSATAQNLITAIKNNSAESIQAYKATIAANVITITQNSTSMNGITLSSSSNANAAIAHTVATATGIDVSGIENMEEFIGQVPTANFTLVTYLGASANAASLAASYGNVLAASTVAAGNANAADNAAVYRVVIAGKTFEGALYEANGALNLNSAQLKMVHAPTREYFTITADTAYASRIDSAANAALVAQDPANTNLTLNGLIHGTTFAQSRTLKINNDAGDIIRDGEVVGSVKGMTASFNTTNFQNLQFEDFTIGVGTAAGDVKFTATINGQQYTRNVTAGAQVAALVEGFKLDLTHAVSGDVLSINLGEGGLTKLSDVANHEVVGKAIKNALMNIGSGLDVRIGLGFEDLLTVTISDVSPNKLYRDSDNNYVSSLSVKNEADQKIANEVIQKALSLIRREQTKVTSQIETVDQFSYSLQSSIEVTQDAADGYLKTDLIDSASQFAENLKAILAAISTLQAGAKVADAGLQIIQQASQ